MVFLIFIKLVREIKSMIKSFKHKGLELFYKKGNKWKMGRCFTFYVAAGMGVE